MLNCPHCNERTISPIKKLFLGPIFEHRCPSCRKHWGISQWSVVVAAVAAASYFGFLMVANPSRQVAQIGMVGMMVAVALALVFVVPVVRK
ncbi:hypothetical protein LF41_927 [Lysobacter dokdonensis DS-58]|uniref:Transmembrane protein n=1 Tax=Lysobacter dokdonensis DS-58 TaxID=1300345 RepID=A0A0A2WQ14_9GAMM|nr:hypothetical protein [Lysobacter dokdonensis]KGQ20390.1 hypothetical protein LF41_927 [Lysobacter dokdonensis DS-58]